MGASAVRRLEVRLARMLVAGLFAGLAGPALAAPPVPVFGTPIWPADLAGEVSIPPSGAGLPAGHGTASDGALVYAGQCAACHGDKLQGVKATGGPALVGGRGTLTAKTPVKTVESSWPYATTLFDYVKRAMPFNAPGSLSDDQVYAVVAYILAQDKIVGADATMNAARLPKVRMPNAAGFVPDPRPDAPKVLTER